ncbi:hypothetical protein LTR08_001064 [Meristemomyces frigidus]|nr:hypothetical protein LTR08_001064 [Meristemomyces frigidus]
MAVPRLPFLWPMLYRSAETPAPAVRAATSRSRALHSTARRRQHETVQQRYGPANEPPPHLGRGEVIVPPAPRTAGEQAKLPKIAKGLQRVGEEEVRAEEGKGEGGAAQSAETEPRLDAGIDGAKAGGSTEAQDEASELPDTKPTESLLETVPDPLQQQQQTETNQPASPDKRPAPEDSHPTFILDEHGPPLHAPPHMEPPRHIHHFDTYGLVKRLTDSAWADSQAITTMKAVRLMLTDNMTLAREALVSKSMVENETYLFRAACAELKTEVTARRRAEQEKMRTERTQLQHEVEILGQRLGQESGVLKDELKGMFDDRKMAVRNEQRGVEAKVQQLNYKITISLQADARSEVEGLRWVMTRRVIIALFAVVGMVVGSLRLSSNALHEREMEERRRANMKTGSTQTDEGSGGSGPSRMGGGEMLVREGDNPAFVSLG